MMIESSGEIGWKWIVLIWDGEVQDYGTAREKISRRR
jgi:hypothetical protein